MAYPDFKLPFLLYTDASDFAVGGVPGQVQDGRERDIICYWSCQLTKSERNYLTIEKEALAAVSAVKEFYPYLYGFRFSLLTNHNPLASLKGMKDVGGRLMRWILFLQQFNFEFKYRPGSMLQNADTMSRITATISKCSSSLNSISEAQSKDDQLLPAIKALQNGESLPQKIAPGLHRTFLHSGALYRQFQKSSTSPCAAQLVVPTSMRDTVLTQLHNQAGHLGISKTLEKVKERF